MDSKRGKHPVKGYSRWVWVFVIVCIPSLTAAVRAAEVAISCGAVGIELSLCRSGAEAWAAQTGNAVKIISTPNSSSERLALYQQLLAAQSRDIDVFQIDIVWPGILADHLVDLRPAVPASVRSAHFPEIIENNLVDGKLVAMPWFTDVGLLYYRKDLLQKYGKPVPSTWQALTAIAGDIQQQERAGGNDRLWGFVWQGRAYEGLTCDALEWIDGFNGGRILNEAGQITVNNPRAETALTLAASWVGRITPRGVLNYDEEQSRGVFQSGNAVFMRNWPYAWPLVNSPGSPVRGKVGVTVLPKGGEAGKHSGTLGGWNLAVSRYSAVRTEAIALARYLTSAEEQRRRAIEGGYNPTRPALYREPAVLRANPLSDTLLQALMSAVARPSSVAEEQYNRVSYEFWNAVHASLSGAQAPGKALTQLERILRRVRRGRCS